MKSVIQFSLFPLLLLVAFHVLFWGQWLGINVLVFSLMLLGYSVAKSPLALASWPVRVTLSATIFLAFMVVLHAGSWATFLWFISLPTALGFLLHPTMIHPLTSFGRFLWGSFKALPSWSKIVKTTSASQKANGEDAVKKTSNWGIYLISLMISLIFLCIYSLASNRFAEWIGRALTEVGRCFEGLNLAWIPFIFLGFLVIGGAAWGVLKTSGKGWLSKSVSDISSLPEELSVNDLFKLRLSFATLIPLNLLLLLLNVSDVTQVWIVDKELLPGNLSQFVHEGTYILIFSILLAVVVVLALVPKAASMHQNFSMLRLLVGAWLAQNAFLVISVAIRNVHYINNSGLAFKRIGVFFFLLLVVIGLVSVWIKIQQRRNGTWLFWVNSWAVYIVLTCSAAVNWSLVVTRYNLEVHQNGNLDYQFLIDDIGTDNLYILLENKSKMDAIGEERGGYGRYGFISVKERIVQKMEKLLKEHKQYPGWQSWNLTYQRNCDALNAYFQSKKYPSK